MERLTSSSREPLVICVLLWLIHRPLPPLNSSISQPEQKKEQQRTLAHAAPAVTGWVFGRASPDVISFPCGSHPGEVCIYKTLPHTFLINGHFLCMLTHMQYPLILTLSTYWNWFRRLYLNSAKLFNNSGTAPWCIVSLLTSNRISIKTIILFPSRASINAQSTVLRLAINCFYKKRFLSGHVNNISARNLLFILKKTWYYQNHKFPLFCTKLYLSFPSDLWLVVGVLPFPCPKLSSQKGAVHWGGHQENTTRFPH